jgi:hypothetical protein
MQYLSDAFTGYRVAGNYLISPAGQRITPTRLEGLLWRDAMELRLAGYVSRRKAEEAKKRFGGVSVKVLVVDLADWHARRFGRAG